MTNNQLLTSIPPSRDGLLTSMRTTLTDEVILEMAKADVPILSEVAANQRVLTHIRDSGIVPGRLQWNPAEACNILRWQVQTQQPVTTMKLFASWILLRAYVQIESFEAGMVADGDEHTIAGLVEAHSTWVTNILSSQPLSFTGLSFPYSMPGNIGMKPALSIFLGC